MQNTALYIHWPFCASKCPYCDFNSHVTESIDHTIWRESYVATLHYYAELLPDRQITSIYFGGGTPSLMHPDTVQAIIDETQKLWHIDNNIEITLEANPTSVEINKFTAFRIAGVNRVSLGIQALNDKDLKFLGRQHSVDEALKALDIAQTTFDRASFDLIYARPQQTLAEWEAELHHAAKLAQGHLSLYQLTIERNTPFYMAHAKGEFTLPKDTLAADFYTLTQDILTAAGLPAYEVSNHAMDGHESRHNLSYWRYEDYIGIGPGAHGRLTLNGQKHATREHSAPQIWLDKTTANGHAHHPFESLTEREQSLERLMMGLRTTEGIRTESIQNTLNQDKFKTALAENWLTQTDTTLKATTTGILRLNALLDFIIN